MVKFEDIIFWVFIVIIVGTALWLLSGSPPEMNAIISVALAVAGSELMIWKTLFKNDKKTSLGFMKVKHDLNLMENKIINKLNHIENKLK